MGQDNLSSALFDWNKGTTALGRWQELSMLVSLVRSSQLSPEWVLKNSDEFFFSLQGGSGDIADGPVLACIGSALPSLATNSEDLPPLARRDPEFPNHTVCYRLSLLHLSAPVPIASICLVFAHYTSLRVSPSSALPRRQHSHSFPATDWSHQQIRRLRYRLERSSKRVVPAQQLRRTRNHHAHRDSSETEIFLEFGPGLFTLFLLQRACRNHKHGIKTLCLVIAHYSPATRSSSRT